MSHRRHANGHSGLLKNNGIFPPDCTASHPKRPYLHNHGCENFNCHMFITGVASTISQLEFNMPQLSQQDLEALLRPTLGRHLVVESFTSKPLTQPGENYGSTMLDIEVTIRHGKDETSSHNLSLVAKLMPTSEFFRKIFDSPVTFCKEITCYMSLKLEYEKLQTEMCIPKEKFLDLFSKCYGARTTMSEEIGDRADENAVILLENLKTLNYRLGDRRVGLDLKHVQLVVSKLAGFHALSVALKLLKPQVFKDTVLKACKPYYKGFDEAEIKSSSLKLLKIIETIPGCDNYLQKVQTGLELADQLELNPSLCPPREPYATFSHSDFWVNNMMFCYDSDDENYPVEVKFLDFQGNVYDSPVKDLLFFLYTSAAEGVMPNNYDELIRLYHQNFTECLKGVGCDISHFTFQSLLDEIDMFAPSEVHHILFMLLPITADKTNIPEISDVDTDTFYHTPNEIYKRKAKEYITDYVQRGWL